MSDPTPENTSPTDEFLSTLEDAPQPRGNSSSPSHTGDSPRTKR